MPSPPSSWRLSWSLRFPRLEAASLAPSSSQIMGFDAPQEGSSSPRVPSDCSAAGHRDLPHSWTAYLLLAVFIGSLISMPPYSDRRHRLGLAQACCDSAPVPSSDCWRVARLLTPAYHLQRWVDQVTEMLLYSWSPRNLPEGVHSAASC